MEIFMAYTRNCFCACRYCDVASPSDKISIAGRRAAILDGAFWGPNKTLQVSFLGGTRKLHDRVAETADLWITDGGARVQFAYLTAADADPRDAEIRIAFMVGRGSWSYLGKQCLDVPKDRPTMNFGWIDESSSTETVQEVVLHEFGHALGLIHEHQNPKNGIVWDREAVKRDVRATQGWDDETIEENIFKKYDPDKVTETDIDPESIMMYPIPEHWTLNNFATGFNKKLSANDKALIRSKYF